MPDTHKVCTRCNARKPVTAFNKRAKAKDGLRQTCKACDGEVRRNWEANQAQVPRPRESPEPPPVPQPAPVQNQIAPKAPQPQLEVRETGTKIREVVIDPDDEEGKARAREYAALLNTKLPIRKRAAILVKIARMASGPTVGLALAALKDINNATGITSKRGEAVEEAPIFVMPEGTSKMRMTGS